MSATRKIDIIDTSCIFQDDEDNSKRIKFELNSITPSTLRILTVPDADTILVGHNVAQTITNKNIDADNNTIINIDNFSIKTNALIDASKIGDGSVSNSEFQYLGSVESTVVGVSDIQILTNKTFTDSSTYFQDDTDNSKKLQFELSQISTGVTRILTMPNQSTILVGTDTIQTLTNKTLINPIIQTGLVTTSSFIEIEDISEPSNPGLGKGRLYKKIDNDGIFWKPDLVGEEVDLTNTSSSSSTSAKFDAYYDPLIETIVFTVWTDVPLDNERVKDSDFSHFLFSPEITINTPGSYLIMARCTTYITSSSNRAQTQMRLVQNTGFGYSQIDGTIGAMYNRNNSEGQNTASVSLILDLNSGDKIKMQSIKISGKSTIRLLSEGCSITIIKV